MCGETSIKSEFAPTNRAVGLKLGSVDSPVELTSRVEQSIRSVIVCFPCILTVSWFDS